jgi:ABC-2 type transport system permease protein
MRAYRAHWRISVREELRYFFSDGLWAGALGGFFAMLLVLFYQATGRSDFFAVFSWSAIVWYLITAQLLVGFKSGLVAEISEQVLDGSIASRMTKPYSLPIALLAEHAGTVLFGSIGALIFMIPLGLLFGGTQALSVLGVVFALTAIVLSLVIDFGICLAIGLLAFWVEDAKPYYWIYSKMLFIFGGLFFPLVIFPGWLQKVALYLPTAFMVYYPARLLVDFNWPLAATVLFGQLAWITIALGTAYFVYSRAMRKVSIHGG